MRIALLSPPFLPIPPPAYAGTERIVAVLAQGLHERGHDVTLFAPGDSTVPYRLVPTIPEALWRSEDPADVAAYFGLTLAKAAAEANRFDIIHSHLDASGILMAHLVSTPVVATLHGRLDITGMSALIDALPDIPLVSISDSQRR
jgi:glycosyltransferase involved in cell wall biosynthesis